MLDVLESREKAAVVKFLRESQVSGLLANVIEVTPERWQDKIANYFVSRSSDGPTEGFNNGLRTILRRTFGMPHFRHYRLRVLDRLGKPQTQEST